MKYILSICFSFYCLQIFCQSPTEEILVRKAIVEMFDGMFKADSARVHQVFHPEMRLMTIATDKSGMPVVQSTNIENFLKSVGTPRKDGPLDERIWSYKIQIDGSLASVHAWRERLPPSFHRAKDDAGREDLLGLSARGGIVAHYDGGIDRAREHGQAEERRESSAQLRQVGLPVAALAVETLAARDGDDDQRRTARRVGSAPTE